MNQLTNTKYLLPVLNESIHKHQGYISRFKWIHYKIQNEGFEETFNGLIVLVSAKVEL